MKNIRKYIYYKFTKYLLFLPTRSLHPLVLYPSGSLGSSPLQYQTHTLEGALLYRIGGEVPITCFRGL